MVKPEEVVEVVNRALAERGLGPAMVVRVHRDALLCDTSAPPVSR
jgi:hypothetical protein